MSRRLERYRREFEGVLPRIRLHAQIVFRAVCCPHKKEDLIAETIALCWCWWLRLRRRGKDPLLFVMAIATYAARAARSGRRVCGQERAKDVLSPRAQSRQQFTVSPLPSISTFCGNPFSEALKDNTRTPVAEQAAFRCDFPAWLSTHTERSRRLIEQMASGETTKRLAELFGISPARVSQLRREFHADWQHFLGESV